jgi:hypothetical protein
MKWFDFLRFYGAFEDLKAQIVALRDVEKGKSENVYLPDPEKYAALLVRAPGGERYRIVGVVVTRER